MTREQTEFDAALEALFDAWRRNVHETDRRLVRAIIDPMARLGTAHAALKQAVAKQESLPPR